MSHFILIMILSQGYGVSVSTAEFFNQQSCEEAGQKFISIKPWLSKATYTCQEQN